VPQFLWLPPIGSNLSCRLADSWMIVPKAVHDQVSGTSSTIAQIAEDIHALGGAHQGARRQGKLCCEQIEFLSPRASILHLSH